MNNLSLNYTILGEGEPLFIIHGLFGSSRNWKSLSRRFAEHFQVILPDLRNHGDSPFYMVMDYQVMVDDVVALMQQLNIQSAHILGHSMGGKVAMKLNQLYPERVNKLIIADIAPVSYQHDYDEILEAVIKLDLSKISSRKDADANLQNAITDQRVRQFLLQNLVFKQGKSSWNLNWEALKSNMSLLTGYEDINQWTINSPSLFIRGEHSDYVTNTYWKLIAEHFINAKLITLKNAGHWLHVEQPAAFYDVVARFIRN